MTNIEEAPNLEESSSIKEDAKCKDIAILPEGEDDRKTFIGHLYSIESRVENLRERALDIEQEKCLLLQELQRMQDNDKHIEFSEGERDEIEALAERLVCRCLTIEISVTTPRNESQENALKCVNELLQQLEGLCECSVEKAIGKTKAYLNACLAEPTGCIDQRFQGSILGCTIDDQKKIKCRLQRLLEDLRKNCQVVSR
ncbi:BAG family molecular chaperone regulator 2-like [Mizuhopecten yessoensis]|uniref:BAG family molecular chaperone regulator 2 n=1 Tax=Mizuhopecten yessoensis TaxID=6573 RepID=A0A210Q9L0_MIZYE|nr:BAG family molecular chaperone regulator 2-like [Mizuhopecten yessoensis]OWF45379.1 BAG family molecular chaperone regulator 2 [Mizuhopecten yessoensis]